MLLGLLLPSVSPLPSCLILVSLFPVCLFPAWTGLLSSSLPSYTLHQRWANPVLEGRIQARSSLSANSLAQATLELVIIYMCWLFLFSFLEPGLCLLLSELACPACFNLTITWISSVLKPLSTEPDVTLDKSVR